ncbi:MAG: enoyl-ACP reductase [Armatimonadetes bacterium]|nr:enoyl-ACP reductase [Armatimonadota bacterium]
MLDGKVGLICNVANQRSSAWAIAQACQRAGATIAVGYRGERELEQLQKLLPELAEEPLVLPVDVTSDEQLAALPTALGEAFGRVDFLVHALAFAKMEDLRGRFVDTSRDGFAVAHDVSAYSLTALSRAVEPLMTAGGSVITLSYLGAVRAMPNYNVMGVAKASLEASVRYLAADLGPQGIRVNAISAGPMRTLAAAAIGDFKGMQSRHAEVSPLRHGTTQEEVAEVTVFLASEASRGMTGNVLYVDSGYHILGAL